MNPDENRSCIYNLSSTTYIDFRGYISQKFPLDPHILMQICIAGPLTFQYFTWNHKILCVVYPDENRYCMHSLANTPYIHFSGYICQKFPPDPPIFIQIPKAGVPIFQYFTWNLKIWRVLNPDESRYCMHSLSSTTYMDFGSYISKTFPLDPHIFMQIYIAGPLTFQYFTWNHKILCVMYPDENRYCLYIL